jgi:hypothetical protein
VTKVKRALRPFGKSTQDAVLPEEKYQIVRQDENDPAEPDSQVESRILQVHGSCAIASQYRQTKEA